MKRLIAWGLSTLFIICVGLAIGTTQKTSIAIAQGNNDGDSGDQEILLTSEIEAQPVELNNLVETDNFGFRSSLLKELSVRTSEVFIGTSFDIVNIKEDENWRFITIVSLDGPESSLEHPGQGASAISAIAYQTPYGAWDTAIAGTTKYSDLLALVPEYIVPDSIKPYLDPLAIDYFDKIDATYLFPWPAGGWEYRQGWHDSNWPGTGAAGLDVGTRGNADMRILAATGGVITGFCGASGSSDTWIRITHDDGKIFYYAHLLKSSIPSGIQVNTRVETGTILGTLKKGAWAWSGCGVANNGSDSAHLHWGIPTNSSITVDGWTIRYSDNTWRKGGDTRIPDLPYQKLVSSNTPRSGGGGPTVPSTPTLNAPPDGAVFAEGQTIVLSWNSVSNATSYFGEITDGPAPYLYFNWQSGTSYEIGPQWPGYEYSWRIKARNSAGDGPFSITRKFKVVPKAPTNMKASAASCSSVKISWTDNSGGENGFKIYRNGTEVGAVGPNSTSYIDGGVQGGKSYTYTVQAHQNGYYSSASPASAVTTPPCLPSTPTLNAPPDGAVFAEGQTIVLSWNSVSNATSYFGEITDGPAPYLYFNWQSGTSYEIGPQWPGYEYSWRIKARNSAGDGPFSITRKFKVVPKAPTSVSASALSCTSVKVTWTDNSGSEDGYKIYRDGTEVGSIGANTTSYTDSGATGGRSYTYTVKAHRNGYFSSAGSASVTTPPCGPAAPGAPGLIAPDDGTTLIEGDPITLSWSSATNATEYYGEITGGPSLMTFGWQSGTSKDIGAQWPGYEYSWHIKSGNSAGESSYSNTWKFTVIPKAPTSVSASVLSCTTVKVTWADNSGSEDGYKIYRDGTEVGSVGANTTSYTNTGVAEGRSYTYTVKAHRNGYFSNAGTVSITTPTCGPAAPGAPDLTAPDDGTILIEGDTITLSWSSVPNATEYYGEITGGPSPMTFGWQSATSKNIGAQWPGYEYSWRIKSGNSGGESSYSDSWKFTVVPKRPTDVSASALSCTTVEVTWTDNSGSEDGYKIYRDGTKIDSVGANVTSYTDNSAAEGRSYTYMVKAHRNGYLSKAGMVSMTTPACSGPIPNTPTVNSIPNNSQSNSYTVNWSTSANATSYDLQEQFNAGGWKTVYSGNNTSKSYTDKAVGTWCYRVRATNSAGASGWSAEQCTTVQATNSSLSSQLFVPHLVQGQANLPGTGWTTGMQFQNAGSAVTDIRLLAYKPDGSYLNCGSKFAVPGGSVNYLMPSACPGSSGGFNGSAVVQSGEPAQGIIHINNDPVGLAGGIYVGTSMTDSSNTLLFPLVKHNHYGRTTTLVVQNASTGTINLTATFRVQGQTFTKSYNDIPANTKVIITPADAGVPAGNSQVGSLTVTATGPVAGASLEHQHNVAIAQNLQATRAFTPADYDTTVYCPLFRNNHTGMRLTTGAQVQNVSDRTQTVTLTYTPGQGGQAIQSTQTVAPGASATFYAPFLGIPNGSVGSVTIMSTGNIVAVVNDEGSQGGLQRATTYACFPAKRVTNRVVLPLYKEFWIGNTSGIQIQNVGSTSASIQITYMATNKDVSVTLTPGVLVLPNSSTTFFGVSQLISPSTMTVLDGTPSALANTYGSVVIESDTPIVAIANESGYGPNPSMQDSKNYEGFNQ